MPPLVDTHAHVHFGRHGDFPGFIGEQDEVLDRAISTGVSRQISVGVDEVDSEAAIKFAQAHEGVWATVGLHPHEASKGLPALDRLAELISEPKVVAVGECGLDFFRNLSDPSDQEFALRYQIELALKHNKPMVWHVRDAFADFFRIIDDYPDVRGVVHCFTAGPTEAAAALDRGFFIALNGIMTFTKNAEQLEAAKMIPLDRLVLETDCPFLAPKPVRGKRNEPAYLRHTAEFLAELRGEDFEELARATTVNAVILFGLQ